MAIALTERGAALDQSTKYKSEVSSDRGNAERWVILTLTLTTLSFKNSARPPSGSNLAGNHSWKPDSQKNDLQTVRLEDQT